MHYFMGLYDSPFDLMSSGEKTVDVRLYDRKRRLLSVGDMITFNKLTNPLEDITVRVKKLTQFSTFKELFETIPASDIGHKGRTVDELLNETYALYSPEKESEWGTLAIEVEKVETT